MNNNSLMNIRVDYPKPHQLMNPLTQKPDEVTIDEMVFGKRYRVLVRFGKGTYSVEGVLIQRTPVYVHLQTVGDKAVFSTTGKLLYFESNKPKTVSPFVEKIVKIFQL